MALAIGKHRRPLTVVPALASIDELVRDMSDNDMPTELRSLGRTPKKWRTQIAAWHRSHIPNGLTEGVNNLIERVTRGAFGFTNFENYRVRSLLSAGEPDWELLGVVSPCEIRRPTMVTEAATQVLIREEWRPQRRRMIIVGVVLILAAAGWSTDEAIGAGGPTAGGGRGPTTRARDVGLDDDSTGRPAPWWLLVPSFFLNTCGRVRASDGTPMVHRWSATPLVGPSPYRAGNSPGRPTSQRADIRRSAFLVQPGRVGVRRANYGPVSRGFPKQWWVAVRPAGAPAPPDFSWVEA